MWRDWLIESPTVEHKWMDNIIIMLYRCLGKGSSRGTDTTEKHRLLASLLNLLQREKHPCFRWASRRPWTGLWIKQAEILTCLSNSTLHKGTHTPARALLHLQPDRDVYHYSSCLPCWYDWCWTPNQEGNFLRWQDHCSLLPRFSNTHKIHVLTCELIVEKHGLKMDLTFSHKPLRPRPLEFWAPKTGLRYLGWK